MFRSQKCCHDRFFVVSFAMMPGSLQSVTFFTSCNFPLWLMCLFVPSLWVLQSWLIWTVFVHSLLSQTLQQHVFVFVSLSAFCHNTEFSSLAKCTPWIPLCMWIAPSVFSSVSTLSSQWPSVRASASLWSVWRGYHVLCRLLESGPCQMSELSRSDVLSTLTDDLLVVLRLEHMELQVHIYKSVIPIVVYSN